MANVFTASTLKIQALVLFPTPFFRIHFSTFLSPWAFNISILAPHVSVFCWAPSPLLCSPMPCSAGFPHRLMFFHLSAWSVPRSQRNEAFSFPGSLANGGDYTGMTCLRRPDAWLRKTNAITFLFIYFFPSHAGENAAHLFWLLWEHGFLTLISLLFQGLTSKWKRC